VYGRWGCGRNRWMRAHHQRRSQQGSDRGVAVAADPRTMVPGRGSILQAYRETLIVDISDGTGFPVLAGGEPPRAWTHPRRQARVPPVPSRHSAGLRSSKTRVVRVLSPTDTLFEWCGVQAFLAAGSPGSVGRPWLLPAGPGVPEGTRGHIGFPPTRRPGVWEGKSVSSPGLAGSPHATHRGGSPKEQCTCTTSVLHLLTSF